MIDIQVSDDAIKTRIIDVVCAQYNRPEFVGKDENGDDIPNPTSKADFTQNIVKSFLKEVTIAYEAGKAADAARILAVNKVKDEIVI